MKTKYIVFLIIILLICISILIYKIDTTPSYDPKVYEEVYKEYEQIINMSSNDQSTDNKIILSHSSTTKYRTIGVIKIPKINVSYPIINDYSESNLDISPVKFMGPNINTVGNLVIAGHNNWNTDFFSNLHKLKNDDIVELTDYKGISVRYKVYNIYQTTQDDFSCLEQDTQGKIELTLITCVKYQKAKRLIVKCVAI